MNGCPVVRQILFSTPCLFIAFTKLESCRKIIDFLICSISEGLTRGPRGPQGGHTSSRTSYHARRRAAEFWWNTKALGLRGLLRLDQSIPEFGWQYLSNATRLIRPRVFCVRFVVSRITIVGYIIRHF